jgi:AcrR family transcriptional regulator
MTTTDGGRRTRRIEQRRQQIIEAAARVFARKGYERATTREIAQEADVSEGTIYNYFSSKQQLLLELADLVQEEFSAIVPEPQTVVDMRSAVVQAVERVLAVIAENAVVIRGLLTAMWDRGYGFHGYLLPGAQKLTAHVEEFLQARVAAGAMRPCDVHLVARMILGMVIYVAVPYIQELEPMPSAEERRQQAELMVSILFDGLRV